MAPPSLPQSIGRSPGQERPVRAGIFGLPAATTSVRLARGHVRALLVEWNSGAETCDNAVLVTSELVTNAVMHTASERIVCRLRADGDAIRIEVEDESRGPSRPVQRLSRPDDQGGRGLLLVGMLSSDWGVKDSPHGHGRIVWAELPYQAEGAETPPGADDDRGDYDRSDYDYADGDLSDCIDDGDPADRPAADRHAWADAARSTRTDAARTNGTSGTGRDGRGSGGTVSLWTGMAPGRAATPATRPAPSRPAPSGPTPSGPAPTGPAALRPVKSGLAPIRPSGPMPTRPVPSGAEPSHPTAPGPHPPRPALPGPHASRPVTTGPMAASRTAVSGPVVPGPAGSGPVASGPAHRPVPHLAEGPRFHGHGPTAHP